MPNEKPILLCVERTLILNLRKQFLKRKKEEKRERKKKTGDLKTLLIN